MTRLVHTADVHLRPEADERFAALEAVLDAADGFDADVLTVGGDLFDRPGDVETLRGELRNRYFTDRPFEVVLIPGNHDVEAFRGDLFFGDACTVVADEDPYGTWVAPDGDLRLTCIPYREAPDDELLVALGERPDFDGVEALLFHGSLDAPIGADDGGESARRYFPVTEPLLAELGFDYHLAGHYHGAHHVQFASGAGFAYPGTPASTRRSETGRRRVVTLEPDRGLAFEPLETHHYLERRITVTPGREDDALAELRRWIDEAVTSTAEPVVHIEGVVDCPEEAFAGRLRELAEPAWLTDETVSVEHVTGHPVVREFEDRLAERDWDEETAAAVRTRLLRAAGRVAAGSKTGFR